jgi:phage tail-like protein
VTEVSSYLQYLPPVLRQPADPLDGRTEATRFGLGRFLLGFEKMLTGLDDDVSIRHPGGQQGHTHDSIATAIARIPELFDPWRAPPEFLQWLASWVALEFPTLQDKPVWDEYQQRKAVSEIARIHRLRGLKQGLNMALDLFAVTTTRPRVAVDDGNKLLTTRPRPDTVAPVTALVSQGPTLTYPIASASAVVVNGLVRPRCITMGLAGELFVGDFGAAGTVSALPGRVWRLDATGTPDMAGTPPLPRPLAPSTPFANVVAVAVSPALAGRPEKLFILDGNRRLFSVDAPYSADSATSVNAALPTVRPVAMAVDSNGDVLILDRGNTVGDPAIPKIVTVAPANPAAPQSRSLTKVVEPLSLLVRADGTLVIGDGQRQDGRAAGNLVIVDRRVPAGWTESPVFPASDIGNQGQAALVSPSAIVDGADGELFVLDAGLRPFATGDTVLTVARPAGVFRVSTDESATLLRVTENGNLVFPTGMALQDDRLVICDPGQLESAQQAPVLSRLSPFRFCVAVHFEEANLPADEQERIRVVGRVDASIRSVVEQLRPAHTLATLIIAG